MFFFPLMFFFLLFWHNEMCGFFLWRLHHWWKGNYRKLVKYWHLYILLGKLESFCHFEILYPNLNIQMRVTWRTGYTLQCIWVALWKQGISFIFGFAQEIVPQLSMWVFALLDLTLEVELIDNKFSMKCSLFCFVLSVSIRCFIFSFWCYYWCCVNKIVSSINSLQRNVHFLEKGAGFHV